MIRLQTMVLLGSLLATAAGCTSPDDSAGDQLVETIAATRTDTIGDHATFYGVGKVSRYQQAMDSSLEDLGPLFFAEIFITRDGEVSDAFISLPAPVGGTRELEYRYSESDEIGDVMYLSDLADDDEALEAVLPSGVYEFTFSTPAGDVDGSAVSLEGSVFPTQPVIIFEQDGGLIAFDEVDPGRELMITWPPFSEGKADPKGILDDLIFVAIDSCTVEDIVHSGRPFEKDDNLTFRAERYTVPAGTLEPGQTYSMYVEHSRQNDTQNDYGIPAFATIASSTYMDFQTTGETDPDYCN